MMHTRRSIAGNIRRRSMVVPLLAPGLSDEKLEQEEEEEQAVELARELGAGEREHV